MPLAPADIPNTPEERWGTIGTYGARGMTGGEALARSLDYSANRNIPRLTSRAGVMVRLRYLTWNKRGNDWLRKAGIQVTDPTITRWKNGRQHPRPDSLLKINQAFWSCRRASLVDHYQQRLWNNGRGTRIEIHPVDQNEVQPNRQRELRMRHLNVRREWQPIVEAWSTNDHARLEDLWQYIADGLGSDHNAYTYVSHLGFGV